MAMTVTAIGQAVLNAQLTEVHPVYGTMATPANRSASITFSAGTGSGQVNAASAVVFTGAAGAHVDITFAAATNDGVLDNPFTYGFIKGILIQNKGAGVVTLSGAYWEAEVGGAPGTVKTLQVGGIVFIANPVGGVAAGTLTVTNTGAVAANVEVSTVGLHT